MACASEWLVLNAAGRHNARKHYWYKTNNPFVPTDLLLVSHSSTTVQKAVEATDVDY